MRKSALGLIAALLSAFLFYQILVLQLSGTVKFFAALLVLGASGLALQRLYGLEGEWGLLLVRGKRGLELIDRLARRSPRAWNVLSDVGLVFGYGASAKILFKHVSWKTLAGSLVLLFVSALFVLPSVLPIAFSVIAFPVSFGQVTRGAGGDGFFIFLILLVVLAGGFAAATTLGLVANAGVIIWSVARSFLGETGALARASPGASFIIPGVNLPLIEGLLALAILLVVHEVAHGILARVARIRLDSAGLVFYGILPIGAFIDPNEKQLQKENPQKQSRVLVAGSAANFFVSLVFFVLVIAFLYASEGAYDNGKIVVARVYAKNTSLAEGMWLKAINGTPVTGLDGYAQLRKGIGPNQTLLIETDKGTFVERTNEQGSIGVLLMRAVKPGWEWVGFAYNLLALVFVLNFLIGSVNLLPVPMFDGYRLAELALRNKLLAQALGAVVVLSFLLNFMPWFWQ
ncbi:MAG: site-2 protease family protein [Candidatus Micrarchaeia archaeon]